MEFQAIFNVFVIITVTIAFLFNVLKKYGNATDTIKLPPGPWKLPLIGNMHQLVGGLPHRILQDMAMKHGTLMQLQLGEIPFVIVSSPKFAKEVLKTHDPVFAGRAQSLSMKVMFYDCEDILCHTYDDYWRQMRKIWSYELQNAKTVRLLEPVRLDGGVRLIASIRNSSSSAGVGESINLSSGFDLADLFPSIKVIQFLSGMMPKLLKLHKKIDNFLEDRVNEHTHNFAAKKCSGEGGEEDLIDCLLRVKESGNVERVFLSFFKI